jgi:hypothetical protein
MFRRLRSRDALKQECLSALRHSQSMKPTPMCQDCAAGRFGCRYAKSMGKGPRFATKRESLRRIDRAATAATGVRKISQPMYGSRKRPDVTRWSATSAEKPCYASVRSPSGAVGTSRTAAQGGMPTMTVQDGPHLGADLRSSLPQSMCYGA